MERVVAHPIPPHYAEEEGLVEQMREVVELWSVPHPSLFRIYAIERTADGPVLLTAPEPASSVADVLIAAKDVARSERTTWAVARVLELAGALTTVEATHGDVTRRAIGFDAVGRALLFPPLARVIALRPRMGMGVIRATNLDAMSPEAARGQLLGTRSDVYQLGYLLYRLLGAPRPFAAETDGTDLAVLQAILTGQVVPPLRSVDVAVPPALEEVVARAMAHSPAERFGSANELAAALTELGEERAETRTTLAAAALVRSQERGAREPVMSRLFDAPIRHPCPKRWDELAPTSEAAIRDCSQCGLSVQRVHTLGSLVPLSGSCVFYDPKR